VVDFHLKLNTGEMTVIQGNVCKDVPDYLESKYGVPKKYIETVDKGAKRK